MSMGGIREKSLVGSCSASPDGRACRPAWLSTLFRLLANSWLDALFAAALFLALFRMPEGVTYPALDNSWSRALPECFVSHAQAGRDYVFTYGPLGAFTSVIYSEDFYWAKYIWELGFHAALGVVFVLFGRRIASRDARVLFYASLLIFGTSMYDLRIVISSLALVVLLLVSAPRVSALVLAGLFLAVLCLIKFTFAAFTLPALLLVTAWKWWETGRGTVLLLPLAFAAGVLGLWLATGQSLTNLPRFIILSLEIAGGYVEGMSCTGPRPSLLLAMAIVGLDVLLCLAVALRARSRARFLICLALTFAAIYLQFRHGFIRHDSGHSPEFFGFALTVPFFLALAEPGVVARWPVRLGFGLTLVLAAQGYQEAENTPSPDLPRRTLALSKTLRARFHVLTHPRAHQAKLRQTELQGREAWQLPKIKALVGDADIDMVSNVQAMLFLNGLHWAPRPVFQSYPAFTPKLLDVNQEFYRGSRAPRFVLFQLSPIDGRFPATEDGGVLFELLRRYRPAVEEKGYFLLQRLESADSEESPSPLRTVEWTTRLGEVVPVFLMPGEYLTASFRFRLRPGGKLLHVLYRNPLLYVNLLLSDGSSRRYRLVPGLAAHEFLLNPLVENSEDFVGLYSGKNGKRIVGLSVTQEDFHGWHPYHADIHLELKAYPSTFVSGSPAAESASWR